MRYIVIGICSISLGLLPAPKANAQLAVAEVIKKGVIKVIKAMDLQVQRLQNKTIMLQNAQKVIENTMSKMKLAEISDWTERQRKLYADYFDELSKVKSILADYHRIRAATLMQVALIQEYKRMYALFKQDKNFSAEELEYMSRIYTGIIDESIKSLDQLFVIISSFSTQMSDAKRLAIINKAADNIEETYNDLKAFNAGNIQLSLARSKDRHDIDVIKKLYGLP